MKPNLSALSMQSLFRFALPLLLSVFLVGCATVNKPKPPSYQDLAAESLGLMDNLATSMSSISDPGSAQSALKSMQGITKQMGNLKSQMQAIENPPAEFQAKYQQQMLEKQGAIAASMMKSMMSVLKNPELAKNLNAAMMQLRQLSSSMR